MAMIRLFLQVDIEGAELKALPEWVSSGILDQVSQFGLEIHTDIHTIVKDRIVPELTHLVAVSKTTYLRLLFTKN
jgi:hypothetical protein